MSLRTIALAALGLLVAGAAVAEEKGVKVGILSCELLNSTNIIVYKNEAFSCVFNPNSGGNEVYTGIIKRIGIDLSIKTNEQIIWGVIAPSTDLGGGALAGTYAGVSASAALGAGIGGKVLLGGLENSIALQPVSIAGITGGGASLGIESFELTLD
ncbi:MAG: DUF992 domain-containing protein [Pseudomonadota bacterium]